MDERRALEFLQKVAADSGDRVNGQSCGVDAFCRHIKATKHSGEASQLDTAERMLTAFHGWKEGALYADKLSRTDIKVYQQRLPGKSDKPTLRVASA